MEFHQAAGRFRGNRRIRIGQLEVTSHGPHAVDQQLNSGILQDVVCRQAAIFRRACERAEFIDMFTFNTHRLPAGREQMQCRDTANQFFCDSRRSIDKVFATVENDERWPSCKRSIKAGTTLFVCTDTPSAAATAGATSEASPRALRSTK